MRSRIGRFGFALALVIAAWALLPWLVQVPANLWQEIEKPWIKYVDSRPPRELPVRPDDRRRFPRNSFGVVLGPDSLSILDTFAGRASRYSGLGDTVIAMHLSAAQLDTLYELALRFRLFDGPGPGATADRLYALAGVHPPLAVTVRAGVARGCWVWLPSGFASEPHLDEWKRLARFTSHIFAMMESDTTYASLPAPRHPRID